MESMEKDFQTLLEEKRREEFKKKMIDDYFKRQKTLRTRMKLLVTELVLAIIGYGLIIYFANVWVALGIWLAIWANNMGMTRTIHQTKNNFYKEVWKDS